MSRRNKRFLVLAVAVAGLIGLGYFAYTSFREPLGSTVTAPGAAAGRPCRSARRAAAAG